MAGLQATDGYLIQGLLLCCYGRLFHMLSRAITVLISVGEQNDVSPVHTRRQVIDTTTLYLFHHQLSPDFKLSVVEKADFHDGNILYFKENLLTDDASQAYYVIVVVLIVSGVAKRQSSQLSDP